MRVSGSRCWMVHSASRTSSCGKSSHFRHAEWKLIRILSHLSVTRQPISVGTPVHCCHAAELPRSALTTHRLPSYLCTPVFWHPRIGSIAENCLKTVIGITAVCRGITETEMEEWWREQQTSWMARIWSRLFALAPSPTTSYLRYELVYLHGLFLLSMSKLTDFCSQ